MKGRKGPKGQTDTSEREVAPFIVFVPLSLHRKTITSPDDLKSLAANGSLPALVSVSSWGRRHVSL